MYYLRNLEIRSTKVSFEALRTSYIHDFYKTHFKYEEIVYVGKSESSSMQKQLDNLPDIINKL